MSSSFEETFWRAVSPGSERLLAGVVLAAAGSGTEDGRSQQQDYLAAYGTMQLIPGSPPVSTKTVMWLASCTKLIATIAALQCVERGLFDLDSPADVDRLLPEWKGTQILTGFDNEKPVLQDAKEKITLKQLLNHTSGLTYDFFPELLRWRKSRGESPLTSRGPITEIFTHPLIFEPGTSFAYGPGLDLAGLMVAGANGCTLEEYMRKNIFDVLGMDDTSFHPREYNDLATRLMPITARISPNGPLADGENLYSPAQLLHLEAQDEYGGGGLFGTAEDYLKLLKSILRNDGQLLKTGSIDLMFTPSISPSSKDALNKWLSDPAYASAAIPGEPPVGTAGCGEWTHGIGGLIGLTDKEGGLKSPWLQWGGAPNLKWWIDRENGSCGIFATQLGPPGEGKHQVLTNLFQKEMSRIFGKNAA
ncbi:beta-lactamase/transpeptidase-like protein [Lindgomyces ingoldianus]|uniref:Beta-lactamase/transpeptidase-like protein n=1 Tax=Lindgomyces ingoldianus TaxID=673940 RepID=A0ACB6QP36_9PLEO|nr:beta-lactamase/transpeptidase-like protein [Lindgomyces ingoldianus]KAF2468671.1 beta-lactamase/transpeptidase-like protein [Lindgomyces ingoldianus]